MAIPDDNGFMPKLLDWGWALLVAMLGLVYKSHKAEMTRHDDRFAEMQSEIDGKASDVEMQNQRRHVEKIYSEIGSLKESAAEIKADLRHIAEALGDVRSTIRRIDDKTIDRHS